MKILEWVESAQERIIRKIIELENRSDPKADKILDLLIKVATIVYLPVEIAKKMLSVPKKIAETIYGVFAEVLMAAVFLITLKLKKEELPK